MRNEKYLGEDCYFEAWSQYDRLSAQLLSHGVQDRFCESIPLLDFIPIWRSSWSVAGTRGHSVSSGATFINKTKYFRLRRYDEVLLLSFSLNALSAL